MTRHPRIYVASPTAAYGTPSRARALSAIREAHPGAVILDPAEMFATNAEWLAAWPKLIRTLDDLLVVPAVDATVGCGVLREVADAIAHGVAVALWTAHGRAPWGAFELIGVPDGTPGACAWVMTKAAGA